MELTMTPKLRLGDDKKLFKMGKIKDIGNGSAEVQLAIVASADFDISHIKKTDWTWNYNSNVSVGSSDTINIPMNSDTAKFQSPYDAFKLKVTMHTGGEVNIKLELDGYFFTFTLTTELLLLNAKDPEVLEKEWLLEDDEDPVIEPEPNEEPDIPAPDVKPIVTGIFNNLKKIINEFVNENKRWFFAGVFIAGFVFHWIIF